MCLQFHRVWISLSQQCVWDGLALLHSSASLLCFPGNYRNCLLYMENLQVFSALEDNTISNPFLWRATVHSVEECILLILLKRDFPTDHDCSENHHRCLRIRMATANIRETYGSSVAEWQPWFFPLLSGSEPDTCSWLLRIWVLQVHHNTSVAQRGQIEALVTTIRVREHPASTSPSALLSFPNDCTHWPIYCFKETKQKKKMVRKIYHFNVKIYIYTFLGWMDLLSSYSKKESSSKQYDGLERWLLVNTSDNTLVLSYSKSGELATITNF